MPSSEQLDELHLVNKNLLSVSKLNSGGGSPRVAHPVKALPLGVQDESYNLDGASSSLGCAKRLNFAGYSEWDVTLALTLPGWGWENGRDSISSGNSEPYWPDTKHIKSG
ncbi:UNVERIFIED_CONTAM: hypothetical protein FKN15_078156 [Acipenser sinensis]